MENDFKIKLLLTVVYFINLIIQYVISIILALQQLQFKSTFVEVIIRLFKIMEDQYLILSFLIMSIYNFKAFTIVIIMSFILLRYL